MARFQQVFAHGGRCGFPISGTEWAEYLAVADGHLGQVDARSSGGQVGPGPRFEKRPQLFQGAVLRGLDDQAVELSVRDGLLVSITALSGALHLFDQFLELVELIVRDPAGGLARGERFQRRADREGLDQLLTRRLANASAAKCVRLDHTHALELSQRLAHRGLADTKLSGDLRLDQPRAGFVVAFDGAKFALVQNAGGKSQGAGPEDQVSGAAVAGHPIQISFGCSDASPDVALKEARRLIQDVGVDILLGPLSGDEGIAISNYAKQVPNKTFVNGTSGAQDTTLKVKAPNFFRFGGDGAQWMAGLGNYAYKTLNWRNVAILGEDYSYPWTQAAGFAAEFCPAGGHSTKRMWVPLGTTAWSSSVRTLPRTLHGF